MQTSLCGYTNIFQKIGFKHYFPGISSNHKMSVWIQTRKCQYLGLELHRVNTQIHYSLSQSLTSTHRIKPGAARQTLILRLMNMLIGSREHSSKPATFSPERGGGGERHTHDCVFRGWTHKEQRDIRYQIMKLTVIYHYCIWLCLVRLLIWIGQARTARMGQTLLLKTQSWQGSECDSIDQTALCKMAWLWRVRKQIRDFCMCVWVRMSEKRISSNQMLLAMHLANSRSSS